MVGKETTTRNLPAEEAAERIGVTAQILKYWNRTGRAPESIRLSRKVRVYPEDRLTQWLEQKRKGTI